MRLPKLAMVGAASIFLSTFVACQGTGPSGSHQESSVKDAGKNTPETVTPGNYYCVAKRLDGPHAGHPWLGGANTPEGACKAAVAMCSRMTGAATAEVGGEGACIPSTPIDNRATGIGQVTDQGRGYWVCPVSEYYNGTPPIDRAWAGIGSTIAEATADAKEKCESRAGFNCNRTFQCFDGSTASVDSK
jgi:hypothetical protein